MADTEIKPELQTTHDSAPTQEQPRFVKKQLDPAERARREQVVAEMEKLRKRVSARFADCSEDELDALADEMVREAVDSLHSKGRIRYESEPHN